MIKTNKPSDFKNAVWTSAAFSTLLVIIHIIKTVFEIHFKYFGIYHWSKYGLKGIILAPLYHSDISHLFSNLIPIFVLLLMIQYFYKSISFKVISSIYILTGLMVWSLSMRDTFHVGASGLVYGFAAFIIGSGIFRKNIKAIAIAMIVFLVYSGLFYGLFPKEGISWESHVYGAVSGLFISWMYRHVKEENEIEKEYFSNEKEKEFLIPRDSFDKTLDKME